MGIDFYFCPNYSLVRQVIYTNPAKGMNYFCFIENNSNVRNTSTYMGKKSKITGYGII